MAEIRIIGTAHVSKESVREVQEAIAEFSPDVVAVELDATRYAALKKQVQEASVESVLEAKTFTQLLVQWILAYLQRKIGLDVGVEPGAEMKAAVEEAEARRISIALIDRDIRITLRRFWHSLSFFEKIKMLYALVASVASIDEQEIDVEELKKQDVIAVAMEEFRNFSPNGARALIDERDAYLAHQIRRLSLSHERILVVIGAGHKEGINRYLASPETLPAIESLTGEVKSRPWGLIFGGIVTFLFVFLLVAILFSGVGTDVLITALLYWVLIHGVLTAVFTLLAKGHPLSALTGFAVSWFTALNPLIAAGWFSAIVEAKIRKPGPGDLGRISRAESIGEMMEIPLFRVVVVAAMANIGSTLGTILYFVFIFPILGIDVGVVMTQGIANMWAAIQAIF
ncbi:MAG TPA: TraB/GumN family protein [Methanoregulaceae archaeon]|jgi:pheromone shutdown-related protein TraB|nr:TraB/GumN family protein [Burkholderiaceae bacterium]NLH25290.1 TraB/GumN family protein [Methanomicrobiales archaeon]HMZ31596.1 TraB/GumN family protein [Methanoregulaceae archaeon]HNI41128.1 TraB/GumN family protein [Methanoregulaceae archaeon]HNO07115.1 TraB/GumN family protein [Methanoregulaceae archaeon]